MKKEEIIHLIEVAVQASCGFCERPGNTPRALFYCGKTVIGERF